MKLLQCPKGGSVHLEVYLLFDAEYTGWVSPLTVDMELLVASVGAQHLVSEVRVR